MVARQLDFYLSTSIDQRPAVFIFGEGERNKEQVPKNVNTNIFGSKMFIRRFKQSSCMLF